VDHDLVGAQDTQNRAGLFVKKVQIEKIVGQPMGEVFHLRDFKVEPGEIAAQGLCLGCDLDPAKQPEISLYRCKGEICAERKCGGKEGQRSKVGSVIAGQLGVPVWSAQVFVAPVDPASVPVIAQANQLVNPL